jgi:3-oxoacyl-[acyl-carrier protein] reductase
MNIDFKGKSVLVVGGTRGIGLSIVNSFLENGAIVHVISRSKNEKNEDLLNSLFRGNVFFYYCDATIEFNLKICSKEVLENCRGSIDILISNVGNGKSGIDAINSAEVWNISWDTNFTSAVNVSRVFYPSISRGGSIIFISSIAGIENIGAPTEYSIAKSSINTFSKILSHKLAPTIRVNTILPGNIYFENGTWDKKLKENPKLVLEMLNKNVPLKKFGYPIDIANAVLFLSSDKASFITGASLIVDGGQTTSF